MPRSRKAYLPARVDADTLRRLDRRAARLGKPRSNLVERYIEEGLRMDDHGGIVFVDGSAGRRAALAAYRGLDVWQVISTLHDNDGDTGATAELLAITETDVRAALGYYAENRPEIDEWIRANAEEAERIEAALRGEQEAARP